VTVLESFSSWRWGWGQKYFDPFYWGIVVHNCNPSTLEAEGGGLRVWNQPGLHNKTLSQNKNKNKNKQNNNKNPSVPSKKYST
jgi:hypothetical protein